MKADKRARSGVEEIERKEKAEVPAPAKKLEQAPAMGALAKGEAQQADKAAAPKAKLSYMEKQQEKALTFTVFVKDTETAVMEIEKILNELEGKTVRIESVEGNKVVSAMLKVNKLHEISERLKIFGEIRQK